MLLSYPEEMQYALPYRHIAGLGGYDYHGNGGGGGMPVTAAAITAAGSGSGGGRDCGCCALGVGKFHLRSAFGPDSAFVVLTGHGISGVVALGHGVVVFCGNTAYRHAFAAL